MKAQSDGIMRPGGNAVTECPVKLFTETVMRMRRKAVYLFYAGAASE